MGGGCARTIFNKQDYYGYQLAVSSDGNTAIIGAPGKNSATGAAYVFTRSGNTWTQQQKLVDADAATNDNFGFAVAVNGDGSTAIIGAYTKNSNAGAAYVFVRNGSTWSQQQKLTASDMATGDFF